MEEAFIFPIAPIMSEELALLTVFGQADQHGQTTGVYAPLQSTYKTISIFNNFTKTLAIKGRPPFNAKAVMAKPKDAPSEVYRLINSPPKTNGAAAG